MAGRLVRLACQRHLDDLATAATKQLVWRPAEAQRVIDFFPAILKLPERADADEAPVDGDDDQDHAPQPFVLSPFQQFIAGSLFGWYKANGRRRFRIAYLETGKGSGKTPFGVGVMIYRCVADGERHAQIYIAATKLDQAKVPFADVEKMVASSPSLKKRFLPTVNNMALPQTGSFIRAISAEKRGLDGKRVSAALLEELHEHPTNDVVQKIRAGIKGRPNALIVEITNSGFDRTSICWHHHELSRQILEGTAQDESWFAFVAQLDPCARCLEAGKSQPDDACPHCDDWRIEGPHWRKPNPNLGVSVAWQYLRDEVRIAVASPTEQNMVKRLNFGIWTDQVTVWITGDRWNQCESAAVTPEALRGRECYVGLDLSEKIDLCSAQFVFPRPLEGAPGMAGEATLTCAFDVLSYFWMPEATLQERAREDHIPYVAWKEAGFLTAWPGRLINHDAVVDFVITEIAGRGYRLRGIGVDQAGATAVVNRLEATFGADLVTEVPQGFKPLSSPSKTLEALVLSGHVRHNRNPVMTMCVGNMGKEENHWREIRPVKLSPRKRIDGGVALIDAIYVAEHAVAADGSGGVDVW